MIRLLSSLLFWGIVIIVVLILFAPHFLAQAGNALVGSLNNSAISGLAQYLPPNVVGKDSALDLSLQGLSPRTTYEVTLDQGSCGGSPSEDLGQFTTHEDGTISTNFAFPSLDTGKKWFINIHQGANPAGPSVVCSQLQLNKDSQIGISTLSDNGSSTIIGNAQSSNGQTSSGSTSATTSGTTPPQGYPNTLPNTGVAPGDKHSYDNTTYPRKY